MPLRPDPLPQDAAQLSRIILSLDAENADLKARVAFLEGQLFGPKSEKMTAIDPTQATLELGDLSDIPVAANDDVAPVAEGPRQERRSPSRNIGRLPKHLPRYEELIEPESKICPCCSFELHCIGTDVSEALDIVPAVVRVKRTIRPRYACRACESVIVQAPAPARVMDGGMVTTAFAAHIAVSKFAWHLPLHRQAQMLASCGVIIDRGTLGAWVTRVAWWLELLYDALTAFIRSQPRVFCDETPLPRLDPGRKRTKLCQLWAQAGMVRRRRRWPILLLKAAALARSRGNCRRLPAYFRSMDTRPIKPWPSAGGRAISPPCGWRSALLTRDASSSMSSS